MLQADAIGTAGTKVFEGPAISTAVGAPSGLVGFLIVRFQVQPNETSSLTRKSVWLNWSNNRPRATQPGAALALCLFVTVVVTWHLHGYSAASTNPSFVVLLCRSFRRDDLCYLRQSAYLSKSLYLACAYHRTINTLVKPLLLKVGNTSCLLVHDLALCLAVVVALFKSWVPVSAQIRQCHCLVIEHPVCGWLLV